MILFIFLTINIEETWSKACAWNMTSKLGIKPQKAKVVIRAKIKVPIQV